METWTGRRMLHILNDIALISKVHVLSTLQAHGGRGIFGVIVGLSATREIACHVKGKFFGFLAKLPKLNEGRMTKEVK